MAVCVDVQPVSSRASNRCGCNRLRHGCQTSCAGCGSPFKPTVFMARSSGGNCLSSAAACSLRYLHRTTQASWLTAHIALQVLCCPYLVQQLLVLMTDLLDCFCMPGSGPHDAMLGTWTGLRRQALSTQLWPYAPFNTDHHSLPWLLDQ